MRKVSWQRAGNVLSGLSLRAVKYCEGLGFFGKAFIGSAAYTDRITPHFSSSRILMILYGRNFAIMGSWFFVMSTNAQL